MKSKMLAGILGVMVVTIVALGAQKQEEVERQLKTAMNMELVDGNLKGAIEQYKKVAQSGIRSLAAQALMYEAVCYQKLGDADARKIFEQIVRDYADQTAVAASARAHLGGSDRAPAAGGTVLRRVWSGANAVDHPDGTRGVSEGSVSPDGRFISYPAWDTGDLAIHDTVTGTNRLLTNNNYANEEYAQNSSFSRDGKQLAYSWFTGFNGNHHYQLRVINWQSTGSVQLRTFYDNPDLGYAVPYGWSPDGKWIATQFWKKDEDRFGGANKSRSQIGLVSVAEGSARILKTLDWHGSSSLFLSPDGKYLAFDQTATDTEMTVRDVFVIDVKSGQLQPAFHGARAVMGWSPDGDRLLFTSDRTGAVGLWAVPFADGKAQGPPELLKSDIGPSSSLGVTAAGALYVYKTVNPRDITLAPIDLEAGKLVGPPVSFSQGFIENPGPAFWSPDGKYLAYQVNSCSNGCIAIRSIATGQVRRVASNLTNARAVHWSPDGRSLLTKGADRTAREGIFLIDVQSGEATAVILSSGLSPITQWSPDGKKVYFNFNLTGRYVERDLASGKERDVYRQAGARGGSLSPDGRYLEVARGDPATKTASLLLVPIGEGQPRELLRVTQPEALAPVNVWTPDSRALIITKNTGSRIELWLTPITGGAPRKLDIDPNLWSGASTSELLSGFALSPDGRSIAFQMGKTVSEIWALENFLPAPKTAKK